MTTKSMTLAEAFPEQQARCRELLRQYAEVAKLPNVNVMFAVAMIEQALRRADEAAAAHDTVAMLRSYEEMRELE